ncbi:MAG: NAD+ synthase [Myxococcales bacterium]
MRIGMAQIDTTVGDFDGNLALARRAAADARAAGCDLLLLPELALAGYPPMDLVEHPAFVAASERAVEALARETDGMTIVAGFVLANPGPYGRSAFNAAAVLSDGRVQATYRKRLLPNYDVFDEARWFEPGEEPVVATVKGCRVGLTICEDAWNDPDSWDRRLYRTDPITALADEGVDVIVNLSASPFVMGKHRLRQRLLAQLARKHRVPIAYCNLVGGNDSLVFDGRSLGIDAAGRTVAMGPRFTEGLVVFDPFTPSQPELPDDPTPDIGDALAALELGLRDYVNKCGFESVVLGLSGGIDSALTAVIAARALGSRSVTAVTMPSPYSSRGSVDDSVALARNLGITLHTLRITAIFDAYQRDLAPLFDRRAPDVTEENLQARIRGNLLMAYSNKYGALVLSTGNKSELAVGYCTLYGDMSGGLAIIADLPKTLVYEMCDYVNSIASPSPLHPLIPLEIIEKAPSAELRPDQKDQDTLPPYDVLDAILHAYIVERRSAAQIIALGHDEALVRRVLRMVDQNEYKRRQAAPGIKVTSKAFGGGRRHPITQKFLQ